MWKRIKDGGRRRAIFKKQNLMAAIPDLFATQAMFDNQFITIRSDMSGLEVQHPETEYRLKKVSEKFIESLHLIVNEPSVGLYRIQEHVKRSLPQLVDRKIELESLQHQVHGVCYDLDYSIKTVQSIQNIPHFTIIQECLRSAIASKQNLERAKLQRKNKKTGDKVETPDEEPEVIEKPHEVEGFICPNCMRLWNSPEELLDHWEIEHNAKYEPVPDDKTNPPPSPTTVPGVAEDEESNQALDKTKVAAAAEEDDNT